MKTTNKLRKQYTRQFYKGNCLYIIIGIIQSVILAISRLYLAWLMQELVDTATGASTT